jgi:predicted RNase H-like HicB family nuclease
VGLAPPRLAAGRFGTLQTIDKCVFLCDAEKDMKLKVIIHEAEEGGYWAEVPALPGCMTQGQTMQELIENLYDAVEGCLSIDMDKIQLKQNDKVMELAV